MGNALQPGCANEMHELLVSVSHHFYITKDGVLRYQEKPMKVDMTNVGFSRNHLIYF